MQNYSKIPAVQAFCNPQKIIALQVLTSLQGCEFKAFKLNHMPNFDIFAIKFKLAPEKIIFKLKPKLTQAQQPHVNKFRQTETCIKQTKDTVTCKPAQTHN